MSFNQKSCYRSLENASDPVDEVLEREQQISFELLFKYFDKKLDEQNKKKGSKLHFDAKQTDNKLQLSKLDWKMNSDSKVTK